MGKRNKKQEPSNVDRSCYQFKVIDYGTYGPGSDNSISKPIEEEKEIEEESTSFHKMRYYDQRFDFKETQYRYAEDASKAAPNPLFNQPKETKNDEFRDGRRRVDLILVTAEDGRKDLDEYRSRFLHNILKTGLDFEIVRGTMRMHKQLLFIKIHAPDSVLDEFNHALGTKKYLRDEHLRFVKPDRTIIGKMLPFTRVKHEREYITYVRREYKEKLYLTNSERSLIVYKILLQLPFGGHVNHFGLNRLLDKKIFLDVYALHDGEYFIARNVHMLSGSAISNARQMLFYTWVGKINAFKLHPLNLIREYLGEKVGMYFAFYEFYNHALIIAAVLGLIIFILALLDETDKIFEKDICMNANSTHICPRCHTFDICPFRKLTNFCNLAKVHRVFDSPVTVIYATFLTVWATTFYVLWNRQQSYWVWLWELNTDRTKDAFRTKYSRNHLAKPKSALTSLNESYAVGFTRYTRLIFTLGLYSSAIAGFIALLIPLFMYKRDEDRILIKRKLVPLDWEEIFLVTIFAVQVVCFVQILGEFILRQTLSFLTKLENHRTYESYFQSFSLKLFVISFMLTFPLLFYYAWVKARDLISKDNLLKTRIAAMKALLNITLLWALGIRFHRTVFGTIVINFAKTSGSTYFLPFRLFEPERKDDWHKCRGYLSFTHCGPFTCLDEVLIVLLATLLIKYIALPFTVYIKGFFIDTQTDFNQGKRITAKVPSWEREYRLDTITEEKMARKYNFLVMQFALVSLVGAVFPLAPLIAFIVNVIHIRYEARMFLLCHRRPLLMETAGIGVWKDIIKILALLCVPANALTIARTTKTISRQLYVRRTGSMRGFLFYILEHMNTTVYQQWNKETRNAVNNYKKNNFVPQSCYFPGLFAVRFDGFLWPIDFPKKGLNFTFNAEHFWFRAGTHLEFSIFSILVLSFASLLYWAITSHTEKSKNIIAVETKLKNDFLEISKRYK